MQRISTGVPGLDEITGGGLPGPRLYLLRGAAGTGKTTLAQQFLLEGAKRGEPVLYVSLSQTADELAQMAASHGWSLDGVAVQSLSEGEESLDLSEQTIFQSANLRLDRTRDAIEAQIQKLNPVRIVYDSLLEIRLLSGNNVRFRREILGFKSFINKKDVTTFLLDTEHSTPDRSEDQLENIAHGLIRLEKILPTYGVAQRRIEVKKMRGTPISDGYHDISIRKGHGITVYPRLVPHVRPTEPLTSDPITCDIDELDDMLGGGLEAGTTSLVVGQSGTGKSTLCSLYARAALTRGEKVGIFLFEEREETFFRRCEGLGIEMREAAESGQLQLRDFDPTEVSSGEFASIAHSIVDTDGVSVIIIDSLTGYLSALPESGKAVTQMQALLKYLSRRGVLTMLVVAQHGLVGQAQATDIDVSFLGDSVLYLRMYEWPGQIRRTIAAIKKRHGPHDLEVHELVIGPKGVSVEPFNAPPPGGEFTPMTHR